MNSFSRHFLFPQRNLIPGSFSRITFTNQRPSLRDGIKMREESICVNQYYDFTKGTFQGQNINCNYLPYTGYTPLITAIRVKRPSIALDLIRFGCQISKPDIQGFTPLDHAAMNDDVTGVKMLLYCALHQDIFNPSHNSDSRCHVSPTTLTFIKSYKLVQSNMESIIL